MLGELLGESSGSVTGVRILEANGDDSVMEVSFRGSGQVLGVGITDIGTFAQTVRPGGVLSSEEANVLLLTEDGEMVSWKGFGVGRPTGPGFSSSWGAAGYARTSSEKLSRMNSVANLVEYELDAEGGYRWKLWEWTGAAS